LRQSLDAAATPISSLLKITGRKANLNGSKGMREPGNQFGHGWGDTCCPVGGEKRVAHRMPKWALQGRLLPVADSLCRQEGEEACW
jgi:hypothetical protein